jgi:glycerol-3-phosphate dehydrogenase
VRCDPRQLAGRTFDVVVIGAGIQGAAVAREAAVRGLRHHPVATYEKFSQS